MEFRLVYEGSLKANAGPQEKQALRRQFHKQLKVLWNQIPLSAFSMLLNASPKPGEISIIESVGGFSFAPLICQKIHLVCHLDITMLRPEAPGSVVTQGGDIDNRLKTLFDSLRMPHNSSELPSSDSPGTDETPFFCLLEDDNLITKVTVEADRLLKVTSTPNDVVLVIQITTRATKMIYKNMGLG